MTQMPLRHATKQPPASAAVAAAIVAAAAVAVAVAVTVSAAHIASERQL